MTNFGDDVGVVDEAGGFGAEELGTLVEDGVAAVGDEARKDDEAVVDFDWSRVAGADNIHMGTRADPTAREDGLRGGGDGADNVRIGDGGFRGEGRGGGDAELFGEPGGEGFGASGRAAPDPDGFEWPYFRDGAGVGLRLFPVTENGEAASVGAGKCVGGDGAGGGSADGGDFAGVGDAEWSSGVWVEEDDEALVGLDATGKVAVEDADELGSESSVGAEGSRHDAKEAAFGEGENGT